MPLVLSGASTPGQSRPGSHGNEGVLRIPQNPSITGTLVSYPGHSLAAGGGSNLSAEMQSVYSTAPAEWASDGFKNNVGNSKENMQ